MLRRLNKHFTWSDDHPNTNGLLRQYFPKGTDLSVHTPEDLQRVANELNERPRKALGWRSPTAVIVSLGFTIV